MSVGSTPTRATGSIATNNEPLTTNQSGPLVQRDDTWPATRKSGFDSPAVHLKCYVPWSNGKRRLSYKEETGVRLPPG